MVIALPLAVLAFMPPMIGDAPLDAEQFMRIIGGLHGEYDDFSFAFEGRCRGVPPGLTVEQLLAGSDSDAPHLDFQGQYLFRSDGATRLDRFDSDTFSGGLGTANHVSVMLNGLMQRVSRFPTARDERPSSNPGGAGSLNEPGSPERINYLWYFRGVSTRVREAGYRCLGWESVDGHDCLKVEFSQPAPTETNSRGRLGMRFWIDLERGGHPLKVEYLDPKGIGIRVRDIRLGRFEKPGGGTVWLPVRGTCETYATFGSTYPSRPVGLETYHLIDGTARMNRGLPDEVFTLDWDGSLPEPESLRNTRQGFRRPVPRRDREGLREALDRRLAIEDANSPQIEVESPESRRSRRTTTIQIIILSLCAVMLAVATWLWRRS